MRFVAQTQTALAHALLSGASRCPLPVLYALSSLAYLWVYFVLRYRRGVVRDNLRAVWPEHSERRLRRLERLVYRFLCDHLIESVYALRISPEELRRRVTLDIPELLVDREAKRSMLVLFVHQGSLSWAAQRVALALALPLHSIYKPLHSAGSERFLRRMRSRFGMRVVVDRELGSDLLRQRHAPPRVVSLGLDHHPGDGKRLWFRFLGNETALSAATCKVIRAMRGPVFYMRMRRVRRGHYALRVERVDTPASPRNYAEIVRRCIAIAEEDMRGQPETGLWSLRRWQFRRRADEPLCEPA